MPFEIRLRTEEEVEPYRLAADTAFGEMPSSNPASLQGYKDRHETDRDFAAFDGNLIVGTAGAYSTRMTVPGGATIPTAAVTDVTVQPTHRRRGIGAMMMREQLQQVRERGEPAAALWASESIIYGRWGYGPAMQHHAVSIDTRHSRFDNQRAASGNVRFVDVEQALEIFPTVWDRAMSTWPGFMTRKAALWEREIRGIDQMKRPGMSRPGDDTPFFILYEEDGSPGGYAFYRTAYPSDPERRGIAIKEFVAVTEAAHAALWRFCFDIDLVWQVSCQSVPVDDQLWWMLADPRRLNRTPNDAIWLRIVDPPAALSARRYALPGKLVIEIVDQFCPWAGGRFELDSDEDGAVCRPTSQQPDLAMGPAEIAAAYLGGARFTDMARAARIEERSQGALKKADIMFSTQKAPWCPLEF